MCAAYTTAQKIMTREALRRVVLTWRLDNSKVVFTNGCFDILHLGHVDYLEKARALGDRLILALNSDASVRRLQKGAERPLQGEMARARILASLEFIDAVCIFDEDTPLELIRFLQPDVLVKGGDYSIDNIAGTQDVLGWGGEVITIPLVEGHSTTHIVNKIKHSSHG
ncbi:MAG: hypothetical protein RLZZ165_2039 [Bacteroidota bacterium]